MATIQEDSEWDVMREQEESLIKVESSGGKANIILDMSSFDLFAMCQQRYNYRHNLNKNVPIKDKSESLDKGSLGHEGLEEYFKLLSVGVHYNDRMQSAIRKMQVFAADPNLCNLDEDEARLTIRAVEESCDFWRWEDEMLIIHHVETPFMYVLYEDEFVRILITGKIDLLVDKPEFAGRPAYYGLPYDHKTYKRDFELMELSNQFMNYCCATGSQFLCVNRIGLHNPEAKKPKPAEEKFLRPMVSYDLQQLEEWKENVKNVIIDEYLNCAASGRWKMNFTSCFKFNRKCEFYEVCKSSGAENKQRLLESEFVTVSPWDVTATLNKKT